jgi:hypothetical protein
VPPVALYVVFNQQATLTDGGGANGRVYYQNAWYQLTPSGGSYSEASGQFAAGFEGYVAVRRLYVSEWFTISSDSRIKTNITEVADDQALQKLRLLKPSTYTYKDFVGKGTDKVYGFIAEEVESVLPYAVSTDDNINSEIPNVYCRCTVNGTTLTMLHNSHLEVDEHGLTHGESGKLEDLERNDQGETYSLVFVGKAGGRIDKKLISVIDSNTFTIDEPFDETEIRENTIFFYGQKVPNFKNLNKNKLGS